MERPPRYGGISSPSEAARAKSLPEFLSLLDLSRLLPAFEAALCTTIPQLLLLTPADLDAMNIQGGIRNRLLKGIAALQAQRRSDSPMADASSSSSSETPPPERRYNSTSSLYIESTITNPDMAQVCFCVALLVHDLIAESEKKLAATDAPPRRDTGDPTFNPFTLFQPRDIFALPGKRRRDEYEAGDAPPPLGAFNVATPAEEDILESLQAMQRMARFSPGCLVVAMIYIQRLRRRVGAELMASTWQPTLLVSIVVAQKVWEDQRYLNVDWSKLCPLLTLQQLNQLEKQFLTLLDFNVGISAAVYTEWYFRLCDLCEKNQVRLRPMDAGEAQYLEIKASIYGNARKASISKSGPMPTDHTPAPASRAVLS